MPVQGPATWPALGRGQMEPQPVRVMLECVTFRSSSNQRLTGNAFEEKGTKPVLQVPEIVIRSQQMTGYKAKRTHELNCRKRDRYARLLARFDPFLATSEPCAMCPMRNVNRIPRGKVLCHADSRVILTKITSQCLVNAKDDGRAWRGPENSDSTATIKAFEALLSPQIPSSGCKSHLLETYAFSSAGLHA